MKLVVLFFRFSFTFCVTSLSHLFSTGHVLESLSVVKINKAGKRQRRLVKLTPRSLLNMDPRGPRVQNERAVGLM
jgi:hypothetical protein